MIYFSSHRVHTFYSLCFLFAFSLSSNAQTIFTAPSTQGMGFPVSFNNVSGLSDYSNNQCHWNYHTVSLNSSLASPYTYGNPGGHLAVSTYSDYGQDGSDYFLFTTNYYTTDLVRWDFGNSLLNTPAAVNLGNFAAQIPIHTEGIQIKRENNLWYGFIVGDNSTNKLIRLDFGTSLANPNPAIVPLGGASHLAWPTEIEIFDDQGKWYGFVSNRSNNSVTRIDFGNSLSNTPSFTNLSSSILNGPCNLRVIQSGNEWYLFIANLLGGTISRADLGNSITNNNPPFTDLGNTGGLALPRAMMFVEDCDGIKGFICNEYTGLLELKFAGDSVKGTLSSNLIGTMGSIYTGCHDFTPFWENGILYFFQTNYNGTITRTQLNPVTSAGFSFYENSSNPPSFAYTGTGNFTMSALINEGVSGLRIQCHPIDITNSTTPVDSLDALFSFSPKLCDSLTYDFKDVSYHDNPIVSWQWNFGDGNASGLQHPTHTFSVAGNYSVQLIIVSALGAMDTILQQLDVNAGIGLPDVQISASQLVLTCSNSIVHLTASGASAYTWSPTYLFANPGMSEQKISLNSSIPIVLAGWNVPGCPVFDTVIIQYENAKNIFIPNVFSPNGDGLNDVFRIPPQFSFELTLFSVYNRYGELLFETDQFSEGWNGQFHNQPQPLSTYYWFIKGKSPCEDIFLKGDVLLIR